MTLLLWIFPNCFWGWPFLLALFWKDWTLICRDLAINLCKVNRALVFHLLIADLRPLFSVHFILPSDDTSRSGLMKALSKYNFWTPNYSFCIGMSLPLVHFDPLGFNVSGCLQPNILRVSTKFQNSSTNLCTPGSGYCIVNYEM